MTKLLEQAIAEVRKLSDHEQDAIAAELMIQVRNIPQHHDLQLSDEQLAELGRRRAEKRPEYMALKEVEARFRRSSRNSYSEEKL